MQKFIEPYNPFWKEEFERLRQVYLDNLGDLQVDVQHVGSTAVPGLYAKPILDIDLIIEKKDSLTEVTRRLMHLGYAEKGEQGIAGRFAFRKLSAYIPLVQPAYQWQGHHLYVCFDDSLALRNHLLFRDTLLGNKHLAAQYNALKKSLMQNPAITREQYTIAKTDFIISVLAFAGLDESELRQIAEANK